MRGERGGGRVGVDYRGILQVFTLLLHVVYTVWTAACCSQLSGFRVMLAFYKCPSMLLPDASNGS